MSFSDDSFQLKFIAGAETHSRRLVPESGFLEDASTNPRAQIGVVVLVCDHSGTSPKFLLVQKAAKPGYPFSDLWALPGGMVRTKDDQPANFTLLATSAVERLRDETGLNIEPNRLKLNTEIPPVTEYPVKGDTCRVIVLALELEGTIASDTGQIRPTAKSIARCSFTDPLTIIDKLAPANRIILARFLWPRIPIEVRSHFEPSIREAIKFCNGVARTIDFPVIQPWSPHVE